jgi:hypothetical protein
MRIAITLVLASVLCLVDAPAWAQVYGYPQKGQSARSRAGRGRRRRGWGDWRRRREGADRALAACLSGRGYTVR